MCSNLAPIERKSVPQREHDMYIPAKIQVADAAGTTRDARSFLGLKTAGKRALNRSYLPPPPPLSRNGKLCRRMCDRCWVMANIPEATPIIPADHGVAFLSGSHGEWTNSDDVRITDLSTGEVTIYNEAVTALARRMDNQRPPASMKKVIVSLIKSGVRNVGQLVGAAYGGAPGAAAGDFITSMATDGVEALIRRAKKKRTTSTARPAPVYVVKQPVRPVVTTTRSRSTPGVSGTNSGEYKLVNCEYTDVITSSTSFLSTAKYINPGNVALGRKAAYTAALYDEYQVASMTVTLQSDLPEGNQTATGEWGIAFTRNPGRGLPLSIQGLSEMDSKVGPVGKDIVWKYSSAGRTIPWKFIRYTATQGHDTMADDGILYICISPGGFGNGITLGYVKISVTYRLRGRALPTAIPGALTWRATSCSSGQLGSTLASMTATGLLSNAYNNAANLLVLNGLNTGDNFLFVVWWSFGSTSVTAPTYNVTNCTNALWGGVNTLTSPGGTQTSYMTIMFMVCTGPNPTISMSNTPGAVAGSTGHYGFVVPISTNSASWDTVFTPNTNQNLQSSKVVALPSAVNDIGPPPVPTPLPEPVYPPEPEPPTPPEPTPASDRPYGEPVMVVPCLADEDIDDETAADEFAAVLAQMSPARRDVILSRLK